MPTYEYICTECHERTEVEATLSEKEKGLNVFCPKCGSKNMAQVFGSFLISGSPSARNNVTTCGPMARPGCCG